MEQRSNEGFCCNHTQKLCHGGGWSGDLEGMYAGQRQWSSATETGVYSTDACHSAVSLYLPALIIDPCLLRYGFHSRLWTSGAVQHTALQRWSPKLKVMSANITVIIMYHKSLPKSRKFESSMNYVKINRLYDFKGGFASIKIVVPTKHTRKKIYFP